MSSLQRRIAAVADTAASARAAPPSDPRLPDLPAGVEVELVGEFGNLRVVVPDPRLLVAAKLARGTPRDVEDAAWWMRERALTADDIRRAIGALPDPVQRETASGNVVLVELVGSARRPK